MTTNLQMTKITGLERGPQRDRVTRAMIEALEKVTVAPVKGQVAFFDDNGPKGGRAMRCALTVRLPFRPSIRVERSAVTTRLAFDAALAVLERQLKRYRERDRDNKRHPKKYFAARRGLVSNEVRRSKLARRA
jgi:ribosome-associated translation inhibitor RaiA